MSCVLSEIDVPVALPECFDNLFFECWSSSFNEQDLSITYLVLYKQNLFYILEPFITCVAWFLKAVEHEPGME